MRHAKIADGCCSGRPASRGLAIGFAGVEVGSGAEAILFPVIFQNPGEAPDERTGGEADGNGEKDPAVKGHTAFFSREFQTRTARAISKRKSMVTATTKSRAIRTEWEVWMACQLEAQDWWSQRTKTVRRNTGEM